MDVVATEVVDVERSQLLGDIPPPGLGDVVDVCEQTLKVGVGLLELAGAGLGGGQELEEVPEELDVQMAPGAGDREIVELGGREPIEIVVGHADTIDRMIQTCPITRWSTPS